MPEHWTARDFLARLTPEQRAQVETQLAVPDTALASSVERADQEAKDPVEDLLRRIVDAGLPAPTDREYRFHPTRRWRADLAWIDSEPLPATRASLIVEVDGGVKNLPGAKKCGECGHVPQGRHNRAKGYEDDCQKLDEATALGYYVLRFTTQQVRSGEAVDVLGRTLRRLRYTRKEIS